MVEPWGQTQQEALEKEGEARVGVTGISHACSARIEGGNSEHTKIIVTQAGDCSQLRLF